MTRHLPGGRGSRFGVDSNIAQRESLDERVTRLVSASEWGFNFSEIHSNQAMAAADRLYLYPVRGLQAIAITSEARINIKTASASNFVRCAVYELKSFKTLSKVTETEALFPTDATGVVAVTLKKKASFDPDKIYFAGGAVSNVAGIPWGWYPLNIQGVYIDVSAPATNALPSTVSISSTTKVDSVTIPLVSYVSSRLAEII